ncbi:MAG: amidohydrolase [Bryobacter sp.]
MNFALLCLLAADADWILHNGKVLTVDQQFRTVQAVAIKDGRISAVGSNTEVLKERGARTRVTDLGGRMLLPGLIDAHVHIEGSALSEFEEKLPVFDSIATMQQWIRAKAKTTPKGEWIIVPRTLPPRFKEMRMPTKQDLDVAPDHPVAFDGSYVWIASTLALKRSGITRNTPNPPAGEVVKGADGEPNGILRNAGHLLQGIPKGAAADESKRMAAIEKMLQIYAAAGLTSVADRAVLPEHVALYEKLKAAGRLPVRVTLTWRMPTTLSTEEMVRQIEASPWTTNYGDDRLKMGSLKLTLDGGQSVGTAYQRVPYGPFGRHLYGQTDPQARGNLFVEPDKLLTVFRAAHKKNWQMTAHVQGGAAIDLLVDTFAKLDQEKPIRPSRSHVMHGSMMSLETIKKMQKVGVAVDVQAAWLHLDGPALSRVFGEAGMRWFFPARTFLQHQIPMAGGSDHMLGYDKDKAVNPFNSFFNFWMMITRRTTEGKVLYPEERLTREEALRTQTIAAAWQEFSETKKGSIEVGKFADFTLIDRDYLTCPEDEIRRIQVLGTIVEGKPVYSSPMLGKLLQ